MQGLNLCLNGMNYMFIPRALVQSFARRLSENRLIYCGRARLAGFYDPFR